MLTPVRARCIIMSTLALALVWGMVNSHRKPITKHSMATTLAAYDLSFLSHLGTIDFNVQSGTQQTAFKKDADANTQAAIRVLKQQGTYESLMTAFQAACYRIDWQPHTNLPGKQGAYVADNPSQHLTALFTAKGVVIKPAIRSKRKREIGLRLSDWGYGNHLTAVAPGKVTAVENRLEYSHSGLVEWYINRANGLEQGFTLAVPPKERRAGRLRLALTVTGTLKPRLVAGGESLRFADAHSHTALRYSDLKAWDARHRTLSVHLEADASRVYLSMDDRAAVYPVTVDPVIKSENELITSNGATSDAFGWSVSLSGNTAVAGTYGKNVGSNQGQGAAYVFVRSGSTWGQQQELISSDGAAEDAFGTSVAIDGDTIIVGAPGKQINTNDRQGVAYIYTRSGNTWTQRKELIASDGVSGSFFGFYTAISSSSIVVGAFDPNAAYVFVGSGSVWALQQELTPNDGAVIESLAISGNTIILGSPGKQVGSNTDQGAAYVFTRSGSTWTQQQQLTASDGAAYDEFGFLLPLVETR